MKYISTLLGALILLFSSLSASAQQPMSPEEQEKKLLESIDLEVERLERLLDLEYWQKFYVDSVLVNNYHAMYDELSELQQSKVQNSNIYTEVIDKWQEAIYQSYKTFFTEEQWKKYLKSGAQKDAKAREKRRNAKNKER